MTQFQHTLRQLLTGEKTETSRIIKSDQYLMNGVVYKTNENACFDRSTWETGKDYAIVPRRGVKSVGRYRVEAIWRQDVRTLTSEQIKAEGFNVPSEFFAVWCNMHDRKPVSMQFGGAVGWLNLEDRPAERYQAWRMTIKVLWETVDWDAPAVKALQIEPKRV